MDSAGSKYILSFGANAKTMRNAAECSIFKGSRGGLRCAPLALWFVVQFVSIVPSSS